MALAAGPLLALVSLGGWLEVQDLTGGACLVAGRVEAAVARHLGHTPFGPDADARARVTVRRSGRGLSAHLQLRSAEGWARGSRGIAARGGSCRDLESALTVSLVLALDQRPQETPAATAMPQSPAAAAPPVSSLVRPAQTAAADPEPRVSWRAWLGAGGVAGALPGVAFGPSLGALAQRSGRSLGSEVRFEWGIPVQLRGSRVQSWRASAALLPCLATRIAPAQVCGGVRVGLLRATGGRSSGAPTLELAGRLVGELFGGAVSIYAEPAVALVRTRLKMDGVPAWTTPRLSAGVGFLVPTP